ncbi:MAG: hypothetical protein JST48_13255 [Bacteroidetes bacterium]|nr:hypothetical protein [Bacteroidota bacterium]
MKLKSLQRFILVAAGVCTVAVILLSHSFYQADLTKAKAGKSKDKKEVTIHAPSDVTAQGQSVELNQQQQSSLLEEISDSSNKNEKLVFVQKTTIKFLKTLFRVIISPNAP